MITLITGGMKCGKSSFALKYILSKNYKNRAFLATAVPFDEDMRRKIEKHRIERGNLFETFEEPLNIAGILKKIDQNYEVILFECLTTYLGNLYYYDVDVEKYVSDFVSVISSMKSDIVIVTNEVGWSIVPENNLARKYAETLGKINSKIASFSDRVYVVISGISVRIK